jgi:hypothetical protein
MVKLAMVLVAQLVAASHARNLRSAGDETIKAAPAVAGVPDSTAGADGRTGEGYAWPAAAAPAVAGVPGSAAGADGRTGEGYAWPAAAAPLP